MKHKVFLALNDSLSLCPSPFTMGTEKEGPCFLLFRPKTRFDASLGDHHYFEILASVLQNLLWGRSQKARSIPLEDVTT